MGYPYGQGQYGQDASMTGQQQGQPATGSVPYAGQQQMPYGQMRMFFYTSLNVLLLFPVTACNVRLGCIVQTLLVAAGSNYDKKSELMLMRHATASV